MKNAGAMLVCWRSERAGDEVLTNTIDLLRARKAPIRRVLYLVQRRRARVVDVRVPGVEVEPVEVDLKDPTLHEPIYRELLASVCPKLIGDVHVNVSPGTPAMHAVWVILHAGGRLPPGTRLWSSQLDQATGKVRLDPVEFPVSTYLAEVTRVARAHPAEVIYDPDARALPRREALERLARLARVPGAPLLVLGERGTGKTRLVETYVAAVKQRERVVTVPCGGLDSAVAESALFGHVKGAYTGAERDRAGLLADAARGILFLDEVQDLPRSAQRMLVRALQDGRRRYRPVGGDEELTSDAELVCASNLSMAELRSRLDPDLFDRISLLSVEIPPLRLCRADIEQDWRRVWAELHGRTSLPSDAPWTAELETTLARSDLPGNLRDLQRLVLLIAAWWIGHSPEAAVQRAIREWGQRESAETAGQFGLGTGTRRERVRWFAGRLALWARQHWGTWDAAARALRCDERTLREDARAAADDVDLRRVGRRGGAP